MNKRKGRKMMGKRKRGTVTEMIGMLVMGKRREG